MSQEFFHRPLRGTLDAAPIFVPKARASPVPPNANRRRVHSIREDLEGRLGTSSLCVVLLGAGGSGLTERREIARNLGSRGMVALVPEDDFPRTLSPTLVEEAVLARSDVDLVFVNVESWGSATEFGQFQGDPRIATKLRVLVRPDHHPIHAPTGGYLRDLYLTHLARYGHVYPVDGGRHVSVPSAPVLVSLLAERYRQIAALRRTSYA